ncbi:MAG: VPLPA-CTERM sorting domain-containing protein [Methylococcaceae bacterium]|nr:VPLPA-CTERM sorting domain-containing protein [Methylococcaceae bacterium]MDP2393591.1 VPLPA-CTERM sorting domain-containing protein [Methylococcaceae bacterium]MDP3019664.1 VPLPA-CTERM sorting domain-containing protein [Methylococcaceae bacterium]MDP3389942.1 VPLPA-CTERM sorting domain-containing protein [Methylococcaceae bacterium]MDP3931987.1 VPLPA-CTERM sorting domain-containing protein [Methylococcaceae bacterium]
MKKSLILSAALLGLTAANAYAHEVVTPVGGDPFTIHEPVITWSNGDHGVGTATGTITNFGTFDEGGNLLSWQANLAAYHFDVSTAGSLDIYTNDRDVDGAETDLWIFKKDDVGTDWSLVAGNKQGQRIDLNTANNIFGVHITGYIDAGQPGISDAGVRQNFDLGSYVALLTNDSANPTGYTVSNPPPVGTKLSNGITWVDHEAFQSVAWTHDLIIKPTSGSLAVVGAPSEVPVPAAVWLMGSALAGLGVVGRKKRPAIAA